MIEFLFVCFRSLFTARRVGDVTGVLRLGVQRFHSATVAVLHHNQLVEGARVKLDSNNNNSRRLSWHHREIPGESSTTHYSYLT